jgi:hypothetical protein
MKTGRDKLNEAHQLLLCTDYATLPGKNINITDTALVRRLIIEENIVKSICSCCIKTAGKYHCIQIVKKAFKNRKILLM